MSVKVNDLSLYQVTSDSPPVYKVRSKWIYIQVFNIYEITL